MINTIAFEEMNLIQQIDKLSDMLGEACFTVVDCVSYQNMTDEQKTQVKDTFFSELKSNQIEVTNEMIDAAEKAFIQSPMPSMLREYKYYTQGEFQKASEQLTEGRKVTIVKFSDFGFPVVINTVIDRVVVEPYAQHRESLKIIHKPKRKRSLFSNRILPKESMLVYEGWLDINTDSLTSTIVRQDQHVIVKQSKYRSFDKQFIQDAINSINGNLIVKLNVS
ncbi:hypothetical protein [Brevibacillus sp. NRS-1366]|uniref:hypothetical protein n=1 Tax=Brevibacillus sp. NRS-1366 TaxID=3233899 RepID=UPI003D23FBDB